MNNPVPNRSKQGLKHARKRSKASRTAQKRLFRWCPVPASTSRPKPVKTQPKRSEGIR